MIKDGILKLIFVPAFALGIPYFSGIITYSRYNFIQLAGAVLYFTFVSFSLWKGCEWCHVRVRRWHGLKDNPIIKILSIYSISFLHILISGTCFSLIWMIISKETFGWLSILQFCLFSILAVTVFTLIYEIMYLSKERQIDNEIVDQLDNELTHAEITALRNELDPHFIFNSLNTLSQLINKDSKADIFNNKLADVYKYFLINKEKELVSAEQEIEFIKNYFFLLQIRHDNKLQLHFNFHSQDIKDIYVIPCALQTLVENAIKHNAFSGAYPLKIFITADAEYLSVQNEIIKKEVAYSTKIGLRNLKKQYLVITNKKIHVQENETTFIVKLPVIKK